MILPWRFLFCHENNQFQEYMYDHGMGLITLNSNSVIRSMSISFNQGWKIACFCFNYNYNLKFSITITIIQVQVIVVQLQLQ